MDSIRHKQIPNQGFPQRWDQGIFKKHYAPILLILFERLLENRVHDDRSHEEVPIDNDHQPIHEELEMLQKTTIKGNKWMTVA